MREAHFFEALIRGGVGQIVSDVREPRAARFELLNQCKSLFHRLMHVMGDIPEGVQNQFIETFKQGHRSVWNLAEVGKIGGAPKAEAENFHIAVEQRHRDKWDAEKFNGALHGDQGDARHGAERRLVIEDVRKHSPYNAKCFFIAVDRQRRPLAYIEGADVVETENVVGVAVRQQNGVEAFESDAEGLLAEVWSGINHDVLAATRDQ